MENEFRLTEISSKVLDSSTNLPLQEKQLLLRNWLAAECSLDLLTSRACSRCGPRRWETRLSLARSSGWLRRLRAGRHLFSGYLTNLLPGLSSLRLSLL